MRYVKTFIICTFSAAFLTGCGAHKGARQPNVGLADFDKYGEAYFLSIDQVPIGVSEQRVRAEYGDKYEIVESAVVEGKLVEKWKFTSYRAKFGLDSISKYMYVTLTDKFVTDVNEVLVEKAKRKKQKQSPSLDPYEELSKLKQLHTKGIITDQEYETKRTLLLERIN